MMIIKEYRGQPLRQIAVADANDRCCACCFNGSGNCLAVAPMQAGMLPDCSGKGSTSPCFYWYYGEKFRINAEQPIALC